MKTKLKIGGLSMAAGASIMGSAYAHFEGMAAIWVWWIIAALCFWIVAMIEVPKPGIVFKIKVAVPSVLLGAVLTLTAGSSYYWYLNWLYGGGNDFPMFAVWIVCAALLCVIVYMVKQRPAQQP